MNMRGKFIALEGGEGSGKSSAVEFLKKELKDFNVVFTREPGGNDNAEEIRNVLVRSREDDLDVLTQILLFEASRRENMVKKVLPALEQGQHVISDRFSAATYGYQLVAGDGMQFEPLFNFVDPVVRENVYPDMTLYLDVDPDVGLSRKHASGDELNAFDVKEAEFYTRVREGMKKYIEDKPHMVIDANQEQQKVREEVKRAILSCIE